MSNNYNSGYRVDDDKAFILENGVKINSLEQLFNVIKGMSETNFHKHVNTAKNDFANWIKHCFVEDELAEFLEQNPNKELTEKVLEGFIAKATEINRLNNGSESVPENNSHNDSVKKIPEPTSDEMEGGKIKGFFEEVTLPAKEKKQLDKEDKLQRKYEKEDKEIKNYEKKVEHLEAEIHTNQEEKKKYENSKGEEEDVLEESKVKFYQQLIKDMKLQINKVFIGQSEVVTKVIMTLICNAHSLLEGVPGLAKTLLIETLARVVKDTTFHRIQFLPDLLPSDIIGGQIFNPSTGEFMTMKGPIFANFVLADEINRAPPKTHAALMEAMQEKKISIDRIDYILDKPFFVLATQNPLENKGTYELPEAVLDRFMFKIMLDYPLREHELIILTENNTTKPTLTKGVTTIITKKQILELQEDVKKVYLSDRIREYVLDIIEATRGKNKNIEGLRFIQYGGGPRATIYLTLAAKANAMLNGRNYVLPEDVIAVAHDILRHRITMNFIGKAHNISSEKIIDEILSKVQPI